MQGIDDLTENAKALATKDILGDGIFVPSSFSHIDDKTREEICALDGEKRVEFILEKCFLAETKDVRFDGEFPLVELEDGVFALELGHKRFEKIDKKYRPLAYAVQLVSAYCELKEGYRVFLPYVSGELTFGAVLAEMAGVPLEIYLAVDEAKNDECDKTCKNLKKIFPKRADINCLEVAEDEKLEAIKNFSDYDDYLFGVDSSLGAVAFECLDDAEEESRFPSVIVAVDTPKDNACEVLKAFEIDAKDEKTARKKLEENFAV